MATMPWGYGGFMAALWRRYEIWWLYGRFIAAIWEAYGGGMGRQKSGQVKAGVFPAKIPGSIWHESCYAAMPQWVMGGATKKSHRSGSEVVERGETSAP